MPRWPLGHHHTSCHRSQDVEGPSWQQSPKKREHNLCVVFTKAPYLGYMDIDIYIYVNILYIYILYRYIFLHIMVYHDIHGYTFLLSDHQYSCHNTMGPFFFMHQDLTTFPPSPPHQNGSPAVLSRFRCPTPQVVEQVSQDSQTLNCAGMQ